MKQTGVVVETDGKTAKVECDRQSACDMCENASVCSEKCKKVYATADNTVNAAVGDFVEIETESKRVLKNAFIVFFLPVILSFVAYFVTERFLGSTLAAIVTLVVLTVSLVLFAFLQNSNEKNRNASKIVRIIK